MSSALFLYAGNFSGSRPLRVSKAIWMSYFIGNVGRWILVHFTLIAQFCKQSRT